MIDEGCDFHDIDSDIDSDTMVFEAFTSLVIDEFAGVFCDEGIAIIIEPVGEGADGVIVEFFMDCRIVKST